MGYKNLHIEEHEQKCAAAAAHKFPLKKYMVATVESEPDGKHCNVIRREEKELFEISNQERLKAYISEYVRKYQEINKRSPNEVLMVACFIDVPALSKKDFIHSNTKLIFLGCKLNSVPEAVAQQVEIHRSHCSAPINGLRKLVRADRVYFEKRTELICTLTNALKKENPNDYLPKITSCIFEKLEFSSQPQRSNSFLFINCDIEEAISHSGKILLTSCRISKITSDSLNGCFIEECDIQQFIVKDSNFSYSGVINETSFTEPPDFSKDVEFSSKSVKFTNCTFEKVEHVADLGNYRVLKNLCEEGHDFNGSATFFGYELETYYNLYLKKPKNITDWIEKLLSLSNLIIFDNGRSLSRPMISLFLLFLITTPLYLWGGVENSASLERGFYEALLYSIKNTLGPLSLALPEDFNLLSAISKPGKALSFFHFITSSTIWFILILAVRRKFKINSA